MSMIFKVIWIVRPPQCVEGSFQIAYWLYREALEKKIRIFLKVTTAVFLLLLNSANKYLI